MFSRIPLLLTRDATPPLTSISLIAWCYLSIGLWPSLADAQPLKPTTHSIPQATQFPSEPFANEATIYDDTWQTKWAESPERSRVFTTAVDDLSWRLRRDTRRERAWFGSEGPRVVVWDQRYFDSRDRGWGGETGFEQNRTFAGLAWRTNESQRSRIEFGYLNQEWDDPGPEDRRFHFFSLNFYY